jgi:hypothetical protein
MDTARPALHARASVINELHAAGVVLFVLSALFLTVIMLAASMAPGYDITGGAISDLGVVEETACSTSPAGGCSPGPTDEGSCSRPS